MDIRVMGRIAYDIGAKVYEAWADKDCSQFIGCFHTYAEAREALEQEAEHKLNGIIARETV